MHRVIVPSRQDHMAQRRLSVSVHVQTDVVAPEVARRRANVWLLENAGNLLRAESPELVIDEPLLWRFDVVLTHPKTGTVGRMGRIEVDATTGGIITDIAEVQAILDRADATDRC